MELILIDNIFCHFLTIVYYFSINQKYSEELNNIL